MSFGYKQVTISGNAPGVEGMSRLIQEIKDVAVNQMGWTIHDDSTNQPSTNHKLILSSNGETNSYPTFYAVLGSGSSTGTAGQDTIMAQMATAWNASLHRVPASGVIVPVASGVMLLGGDSNGVFNAWISGNKDSINVITRVGASTYDNIMFGRASSFHSTSIHPYPLFVNADSNASTLIAGSPNVRVIARNPPEAFTNGAEGEALDMDSFATSNQPYDSTISGGVQSVYAAVPMFLTVDDTAPARKEVLGVIPNTWTGAGSSMGMLNESILTMSGTDGTVQTYIAFNVNTLISLIIRRS